jgi:hypothetical protein
LWQPIHQQPLQEMVRRAKLTDHSNHRQLCAGRISDS